MENKNIKLLKELVDPLDNYGKEYIDLIEAAANDNRLCNRKFSVAKNRKYKEKFFNELNRDYIYCEIHHIIPKCCGGTDDTDNLIYLFCTEEYPEHLRAHEYLWRSTSLFTEYHSKLSSSFFKMTHSRKLPIDLTIEELAKLRKEYGEFKSVTNSGKYGKNKRANKILYNGVEYPSSSSLAEVEIDGSRRDRHTILRWAQHGLHGLSLLNGKVIPLPVKEKKPVIGIEIIFNGIVYHSARSLTGVDLGGGIVLKSHSTVLSAARKGLCGLQIKDSKYLKQPERKKKPKVYKTREQRILASPRSIQIEYCGIIYPSARSLESVVLPDGKCHDKQTIISWAKKEKYGLKIVPK